jgi:hypothetical protein
MHLEAAVSAEKFTVLASALKLLDGAILALHYFPKLVNLLLALQSFLLRFFEKERSVV